MNNKDKYYKDITAAAALLHDLGKFIRRARIDEDCKHWEHSYKYIKEYFNGYESISEEDINLIAILAALHHKSELDKRMKDIKDRIEKENKDYLVNLLNNLNKIKEYKDNLDKKDNVNKTYEKIVSSIITGDFDSASERKIGEDKDIRNKSERDSSELCPLNNIFGVLNSALNNHEDTFKYKHTYFEPNSLLEMKNNEEKIVDFVKEVSPKIRENLNAFKEEIDISKKFKDITFEDCINIWNFSLKKYSFFICSSKWERLKDISLYNHSQTTAAIAISKYLDTTKAKEYHIISGRFYNIQNYIYDGINSNMEKPLKRIFVRSYLISLINILVPNILVKKLGLYTFNLLFCGGGTFNILIPKDKNIVNFAEKLMDELKEQIKDLFNNKIYLEYVSEKIRIKTVQDRTRYEKGFKTASMNLYEKKYNRSIEHLIYDGSKEYFKCENCGINYVKNDNKKKCSTCSLEDAWIEASNLNDIKDFYIDYNNVNLEDIRDPNNFTKNKIKEGTPIICFSYDEADRIKEQYPIIDVYDIGKTYIKKTYDKCEGCYGKDKCDGPLKGDEKDNTPLVSLDCFSHMSENDTIIATAKVDVDDFQFLLYHVYPRKIMSEVYNFSISRLANTSSFFNLFFSMHLRRVLEEKFKDSLMILYAGGDDIMITGNWEKVVEAVLSIKEEMRKITGADKVENTDNITITSGILFHNSQRPFNLVVKQVGNLLEQGKESGKNCVNLNGNILKFDELQEASNISNDLINDKLRKNIINRSLLFKMNELIKMVSSNDDIEKMRAYAIYNYLINSEIKEKKFDEDGKKNSEIKKEIMMILETIIIKDKSKHNKDYKYAKEKSIIEFAIRKSRERISGNE